MTRPAPAAASVRLHDAALHPRAAFCPMQLMARAACISAFLRAPDLNQTGRNDDSSDSVGPGPLDARAMSIGVQCNPRLGDAGLTIAAVIASPVSRPICLAGMRTVVKDGSISPAPLKSPMPVMEMSSGTAKPIAVAP